MKNSQQDIQFMKSALAIARRGLGRVAPNPSVGCVIVKDGIVVGRARTSDGGRPHAETEALKQAGDTAQGSTVYVSLEPCAHHGKTPPCVEALIQAGVARVVIACLDPDPRTGGKSVGILKEAGIQVTLGVCEEEACALNAGFFLRITKQRPYITLKTATSADEKVAGGNERWVTGATSRARAHLMRSQYDAILVGSGTALADDPLLTTRVAGLNHDIKRLVLDRRGRIEPEKRRDGIEYMQVESIEQLVQDLAGRGITRLLVEGGPTIHKAFIDAGLYDEIAWFKASHEIGANGTPALEKASFGDICKAMLVCETYQCGDDLLEIYKR